MRHHESSTIGVALLALFLAAPVPALAERYVVSADTEENEVRFRSEATVESFEGHTDHVLGWIELDPADLRAGVRWRIEVDLASLDTGIGLRNRHMRENHLHTDRFPRAVFEGAARGDGLPARLDAQPRFECLVGGVLSLHGVEREREVVVTIEPRDDGALEIRSEFGVILSDHEIPRPKFLMLKLSEQQQIRVHLIARIEEESSR